MTEAWSSAARVEGEVPGPRRKSATWPWVLAGCGGLSLLVGIGLALVLPSLLRKFELVPPFTVVSGEELARSPALEAEVRGLAGLAQDEVIVWYYGAGLRVADQGSLLTDRRVIGWQLDEFGSSEAEDLMIETAAFDEVRWLGLHFRPDGDVDSLLWVYRDDEDDVFGLWLDTDQLRRGVFVDDLEAACREAGDHYQRRFDADASESEAAPAPALEGR